MSAARPARWPIDFRLRHAVSDAIYGPADRYVSRDRLETMLDHEYNLLLERLDEKSASSGPFSCSPTPLPHGASSSITNRTAGSAFVSKTETRGEPSQIIIHVRMLDEAIVDQQEALGIIGVNLLYGAFYHRAAGEPDRVAPGEPRSGRIEVDMIRFSGPAFAGVDNRLMSLQLVSRV